MRITFLLLITLIASISYGHKFYVSIADMEYDEDDQSINVALKMTAHDFEEILALKFDQKIQLENHNDSSDVMGYTILYLKKNFKLYSSGKKCPIVFLGKEINLKGELYFYFSFTEVKDPTAVKIINKLLFSVSDQQQNIVHYKYKNATKSVTLVPSKSEAEINFDE